MESGPKENYRTALLFVGALALRLALLYIFQPLTVRGDEFNYWRLSRDVLAGSYTEIFFLPLWPHVIAASTALWDSQTAPRLVAIVLGSLNVALVYRIGLRVFDGRAAFVAGLLYALYPEHAFFSSYVYAEVLLESFILAGVAVFFGRWPAMPGPGRAAAAFFILGVGTLCKHFTVIAWAALLIAVFMSGSGRKARLYGAALIYFIPALLFSAWAGAKAGDPFAMINTPIKSALEWQQKPGMGFSLNERNDLLTEGLSKRKSQALGKKSKAAWTNLANLWTPNSYVSGRMRAGYYAGGERVAITYVVAAAQFVLLAAGVVGLVCAPSGMFRTYSIWTLALLSGMCAVWLMVSRYRIPALHVPVLWAAFAFSHRAFVANGLKKSGQAMSAGLLIALIGVIYILRWNTVGFWP